MTDPMLVAVDVGNSAVKVAVAAADSKQDRGPTVEDVVWRTFPLDQPGWQQRLVEWVRTECQQRGDSGGASWWVSTVNLGASNPLRAFCGEAAIASGRPLEWHRVVHQDIPLAIKLDAPQRLGIDRAVGAYAASLRYTPPLVVVDVGSAVTVDWVLPHDQRIAAFCGGAIFPGIRLQTTALSSGTEGLRRPASGGVPTNTPAPLSRLAPGRNTADAIRVGVIASVTGAIERLTAEYAGPESDEPTVIVSGGDGAVIAEHLRIRHVQIPHLVCQGLLDLATKRCRNTAGGLK